MYTTVELTGVENNQAVTREEYPDFYFDLQRAILASLRDSGKLNQIQFRQAEEMLKIQKSTANREKFKNMGNA